MLCLFVYYVCVAFVSFHRRVMNVSYDCCFDVLFFFFKQKTAYEMRISDWSSDVCSSDLATRHISFLFSALIMLSEWMRPRRKDAMPSSAIRSRMTSGRKALLA